MALVQRFSFILLFAALFSLAGCGGSSGGFDDTPDGGTTPEPITITLAISDKNVSRITPQTLTATVMQGTTPLLGKLVTFSIDNTDLASFNNDVGTSSTEADGRALIVLLAGSSSGSGIVTASVDGIDSTPVVFDSAGDGGDIGVPIASDISLFASSQQIASSGNEEVTLTTIAKDENNNLVEGVAISFMTTSGQIQVITPVTGPDGKATAILKTSNEPTNRDITITSESGGISDAVNVEVTGTTINLTGSSSLAINDENSFFIQVLNSEGVGIPNIVVDFSLSGVGSEPVADIAIVDSVTTDITGQASFSVMGTSGGSNTITARAVGYSVSHIVSVQSDSFLFSRFDNGEQTVSPEVTALPDVLLSKDALIELTWTQSNTPIADGTIVSFTSTRGVVTPSSVAIVNGKAITNIRSTNAGKSLVTASGTSGSVTLSNQLEFEFIAETASTIVAQASPNSIAPNGETSTISVVIKDINGNLVKGKTIDFSLSGTSSGSILPASAVTDSNGTASTVYTSNSVSAQDGISVIATVKSEPSISDAVTLTVADRELFIALGTGNDLIESDSTSYNKQYSVFVTDVDSTPQEGIVLKVSAVPSDYYKGQWAKSLDEEGGFASWQASYSTTPPCPNEDLNIDGILDVGEDTNGNGMLTPGNVVSVLGEVTTDEFGQAIIDIRYAQSFATWVNINLIVSAKVSGTESLAQTRFTLPVLASDVLDENVTPPNTGIGLIGPFGQVGSCTNAD
ncbi:Ig-like domain-containing protein [Cognaticolwellia mytili]|uniref:Ig-like domain-containing protein n=1 Tax=Cognaticolwellia mytili TaxID=1888913 RepID=UPI001301A3BE|nr:Ig-like domain-containing protein [Cognaticolwellia mytili]